MTISNVYAESDLYIAAELNAHLLQAPFRSLCHVTTSGTSPNSTLLPDRDR